MATIGIVCDPTSSGATARRITGDAVHRDGRGDPGDDRDGEPDERLADGRDGVAEGLVAELPERGEDARRRREDELAQARGPRVDLPGDQDARDEEDRRQQASAERHAGSGHGR